MTSELVVDVQPKEISIALLEDKNLVEFQKEERNLSFSVGNMYVGKIRKLMPGLNACFVDVGFEKDAFLHYLDLGPQFNSYQKYLKQVISDRKKLYPMSKASILPDIDKDGTISNVLQQGQEVIVQIVKEPISTKGPRLTCELSFAGRYLVLIPFNDKVSVSQKIKSRRRARTLKAIIAKYQTEKLRSNSTYRSRRKACCRTGCRTESITEALGRYHLKSTKGNQTAFIGIRGNKPHGSHAARLIQPFV